MTARGKNCVTGVSPPTIRATDVSKRSPFNFVGCKQTSHSRRPRGADATVEHALSTRECTKAFHVDMWHRRLAGEATALGLLASTGETPVPHLIVNCSNPDAAATELA